MVVIAGGLIPLVFIFPLALVILSLIRALNIEKYQLVQTCDKVEEKPMNKIKNLVAISIIETIWGIGVSFTAGVLSP